MRDKLAKADERRCKLSAAAGQGVEVVSSCKGHCEDKRSVESAMENELYLAVDCGLGPQHRSRILKRYSRGYRDQRFWIFEKRKRIGYSRS